MRTQRGGRLRFGSGLLFRFGNDTNIFGGSLDALIVSPYRVTVLLENSKFVLESCCVQMPDIAGIGILCDQLESYLFATATDQERLGTSQVQQASASSARCLC
jgi:hypothetical protein